jgi:hypothetical protein
LWVKGEDLGPAKRKSLAALPLSAAARKLEISRGADLSLLAYLASGVKLSSLGRDLSWTGPRGACEYTSAAAAEA